MKSLHTYLIIFTFFAFTACNTTKETLSLGTYYGKLPCADCPSINMELLLKADNAYTLKMFYEDRDTEAEETSGSYQIQADSILVLQSQDDGMNKFVISGETLMMLDRVGNPIESDFSERYLLTKNKPENFLLQSLEVSTTPNFKATGNEPSWALMIEFDKKMEFKTIAAESFELTTPVPEPQKGQDLNITNYLAETEAGTLEVSLIKEKCIDDMSGTEFNYSVHIRAKTGAMKTLHEFKGCGDFLKK